MPHEARHSQANRRVTGMRLTSMGEHLYLADQKSCFSNILKKKKNQTLLLHNRYIVLLVQDVLMRDLADNNTPVLILIPAQLQVFSQWVRLHLHPHAFFFCLRYFGQLL